MKVLAAVDATLLPLREWTRAAPKNRYHGQMLGGVPFRVEAKGDDAGRKASEQLLRELARKRLLSIRRSTRAKFPLLKLTETGEMFTRGLVDFPGRDEGRAFLMLVAELSENVKPIRRERWVREIDFNGARGWGDATEAEW